jgi:hypothetical protein
MNHKSYYINYHMKCFITFIVGNNLETRCHLVSIVKKNLHVIGSIGIREYHIDSLLIGAMSYIINGKLLLMYFGNYTYLMSI